MSARSRSPRSGRAHGSPRSKSGRSSMSAAPTSETHEHLLRPLAPEVLALLVRRYGPFDACEDAVQEALLAAVKQWPETGVPGLTTSRPERDYLLRKAAAIAG